MTSTSGTAGKPKKQAVPLRADGLRVTLVVSRFNSFITDHLVKGAIDILERLGAKTGDIVEVPVPGAFEIPAMARRVVLEGKCDAVVTLGCVIRGATAHFDYVAGECAAGVARVALEGAERGTAVSFGVLTVDSIEQAIERAGTKAGNKGADAAMAAVEMVRALRAIGLTGAGAK